MTKIPGIEWFWAITRVSSPKMHVFSVCESNLYSFSFRKEHSVRWKPPLIIWNTRKFIFRICESTKGGYFMIFDLEDTGSKEHRYFGAEDLVKHMCQLAIFLPFLPSDLQHFWNITQCCLSMMPINLRNADYRYTMLETFKCVCRQLHDKKKAPVRRNSWTHMNWFHTSQITMYTGVERPHISSLQRCPTLLAMA